MWPSITPFLDWHLDISKRIYQSIGENKANTLQTFKDIFLNEISCCYELIMLRVITAEVKVFKIYIGTLGHALAREP